MDVLMPHNIQNKLFSSRIFVIVVERISRLLLYVFEHLIDVYFIGIRHRTSITFGQTTIVTGILCARYVFEYQRVWLLFDIEAFLNAGLLFLEEYRESHCKGFFAAQSLKILFPECLVI